MSEKNREKELFKHFTNLVVKGSLLVVFCVLLALIYIPYSSSIDEMFKKGPEPIVSNSKTYTSNATDNDKVVDGIHLATGMKYDKNFTIVKNACTSCHSAKLITQNRATREGWEQMIRWMQATQGLPDLGQNEPKILDYLAKNYAPEKKGRRTVLNPDEIEWYVLELDQ